MSWQTREHIVPSTVRLVATSVSDYETAFLYTAVTMYWPSDRDPLNL